ncbi:MAG: hypothetical protein RSD36_16200 [Terrisporobacter sp.]
MLFHEFAKMLQPVLLEGDSTANFARNLIINITNLPYDMDPNPIYYGDAAWSSYFNGGRPIRKTASMINKYIDEEKFVSYIDDLSDGARDVICDELIKLYPDVNNFNVGEKCAHLFKSILIESAKPSNEKNITKTSISNTKEVKRENLKDNIETHLLIEANGVCQNYNCCGPLYILENGQCKISYKITVIDPSLPNDNCDNLIALCHKCSDKYNLSLNDENIKEMKNIKNKLLFKYDIKDILGHSKLQSGINIAMIKIKNAPIDKLTQSNYIQLSIYDKISMENMALIVKIVAYVSTYYNYVKDLFQHLDKEGKLGLIILTTQIKLNYLYLKNKNLSLCEIYESLVDWLKNSLNEDREPCEVIISFFVQDNHIFDALTR